MTETETETEQQPEEPALELDHYWGSRIFAGLTQDRGKLTKDGI